MAPHEGEAGPDGQGSRFGAMKRRAIVSMKAAMRRDSGKDESVSSVEKQARDLAQERSNVKRLYKKAKACDKHLKVLSSRLRTLSEELMHQCERDGGVDRLTPAPLESTAQGAMELSKICEGAAEGLWSTEIQAQEVVKALRSTGQERSDVEHYRQKLASMDESNEKHDRTQKKLTTARSKLDEGRRHIDEMLTEYKRDGHGKALSLAASALAREFIWANETQYSLSALAELKSGWLRSVSSASEVGEWLARAEGVSKPSFPVEKKRHENDKEESEESKTEDAANLEGLEGEERVQELERRLKEREEECVRLREEKGDLREQLDQQKRECEELRRRLQNQQDVSNSFDDESEEEDEGVDGAARPYTTKQGKNREISSRAVGVALRPNQDQDFEEDSL